MSPSRVIRFVSGELSPGEQLEVLEHAAGCGACRALIEQQRALHAALGEWDAPRPSDDLIDTVLGRLEAARAAPVRRFGLADFLRIAAVVALGVGVGHAAGRWAHDAESGQVLARGAAAEDTPNYELLSEPDVIGLWAVYDELSSEGGEDAS